MGEETGTVELMTAAWGEALEQRIEALEEFTGVNRNAAENYPGQKLKPTQPTLSPEDIERLKSVVRAAVVDCNNENSLGAGVHLRNAAQILGMEDG